MKKILLVLICFLFLFAAQARKEPLKPTVHGNGLPFIEGITMELPDANVSTETDVFTVETCVTPPAGYNFHPFTRNIYRPIRDLEVWGGVGAAPLVFMRYGNSRSSGPPSGGPLGSPGFGGRWNHSYNYKVSHLKFHNNNDQAGVNDSFKTVIYDPVGIFYGFKKYRTDPWMPDDESSGARLFEDGTDLILQKADGFRYRFEKLDVTTPCTAACPPSSFPPLKAGDPCTICYYYRLKNFLDPYQNLFKLEYDGNNRITFIREPDAAGRYLQITYSGNVISKVQTNDGRSVLYNYTGGSLSSVAYGDGAQAIYTAGHDIDPRLDGNITNLAYSTVTAGLQEKNGITGALMATLDTNTVNRKIFYTNGRRQVYNMADSLKINAYTDGYGSTTQYQYENGGRGYLQKATDVLGRSVTYTRTMYGNPLTITNPDNTTEVWTRDNLDLVLTYKDRLGHVTTYHRDANHRVDRIDYFDGSFETFTTYNGFGQYADHQRRNGGNEHSVYDSRGLLKSFTDAEGNTTNYTYYTNDLLKAIMDARNYTTTYEYNERGLVTKITNPDGSFQQYEYDNFGNRTKITNELGNSWTTAHDEFNRPTTLTDPQNRTTVYSYAYPNGLPGACCTYSEPKPTQIKLPSGKTTEIAYDVEWQKIRETAGGGTSEAATTFFENDIVGRPIKMIDPKGKQWLTQYDVMNRKKSETDPLGNQTQWTYDDAGRELTEKRPDNSTTTNAYDDINRKLTTTDPKNQKVIKEFDSEGNLIKLTDPDNNVYQFQRDNLGRLKKTIYPDGTYEENTYDPAGNLLTYRNRMGKIRTSTYDSRNQLLSTVWNLGGSVFYTRDKAGRLTRISNNESTIGYAYNNANEPVGDTQMINGLTPKVVSYIPNQDDLLQTLKYPGGAELTYNRTDKNQISSIKEAGQAWGAYTYDRNGDYLTKTLLNKTVGTYRHDDANRLLSIDYKLACASFSRFDYGYDNVNRRTFVQRNGDKGDAYTHDAADQLTDVKYEVANPDGNPGAAQRTVQYNHDAAGNRTSVIDNGTTKPYSHNNLNQYTAAEGDGLTYDGNGNLIIRLVAGMPDTRYFHDDDSRFLGAEQSSSGMYVGVARDPLNRVVKRLINGTTTYFYYHNWDVIEERSQSDVLLARYVHGAGTDELLAKISGTDTVYYHHDGLGSVVGLTNPKGEVIEQYSYDVYGAPTIKDKNGAILAESAYGNRFLFTGREYVKEFGLYDYRNRMYSPKLGRFLEPDPIGFNAGDANIYSYVKNNSINSRDRLGLEETEAGEGVEMPTPTITTTVVLHSLELVGEVLHHAGIVTEAAGKAIGQGCDLAGLGIELAETLPAATYAGVLVKVQTATTDYTVLAARDSSFDKKADELRNLYNRLLVLANKK